MADTFVVFNTRYGDIKFKLFTDKAPKTCENFLGLVKKGYYDGIIFHRVIKGLPQIDSPPRPVPVGSPP